MDRTVDAPGRCADEPRPDGRGPAVPDGRSGGHLGGLIVSRVASLRIEFKEVRANEEFGRERSATTASFDRSDPLPDKASLTRGGCRFTGGCATPICDT